MEQEGSGERIADQLQSAFVQDKAIQPGPAENSVVELPGSDRDTKCEKVVIHLGTDLIKGYLEAPTWTTIEELLQNAPAGLPQTLHLRRIGSDRFEDIQIEDAKAVFYVNNLTGVVCTK